MITRTLNPLPFGDLDPRRFEDLVRQLAYDFRPWRRLESTGRAGSDDGFDARGFEIVEGTLLPREAQVEEVDESIQPPEGAGDRLWLIQCKREHMINPAKMKKHLAGIVMGEIPLYGIIFAAACDFSLSTRNVLVAWCRQHGISEWHMWGKGELEDMLFQPKNDSLLFAYFNISLAIRARSRATTKRHEIAVKRNLVRLLDASSNALLLRDVNDTDYPWAPEAAAVRKWKVVYPCRLEHDGLAVEIFAAAAWLQGEEWDAATSAPRQDVQRLYDDPWAESSEAQQKLAEQASATWEQLPENERAWIHFEGIVRYEDIVTIDEIGDPEFDGPTVYVADWRRGYCRIKAEIRQVAPPRRVMSVHSARDELRRTKFDNAVRGDPIFGALF